MGLWWKGQWHTVTIPPLLERVPSPRRRTSHLDQWHSSCQGPNILMSHTSQQFYFKVAPLSLPILHPPPLLVPSFLSTAAFRHPLPHNLSVIPLTLTFLPVCLSICPVYPSYHASRWSFHLSPWLSFPTQRPAAHPGGAAGLVCFMSREDGRMKGPPGIPLCHQHLASTLSANVVGAAASLASAAGINALRRFASTDPSWTCTWFSPPPPKTHHMCIWPAHVRFPTGTMVVLSWGCALTVVTDWSLLIC